MHANVRTTLKQTIEDVRSGMRIRVIFPYGDEVLLIAVIWASMPQQSRVWERKRLAQGL